LAELFSFFEVVAWIVGHFDKQPGSKLELSPPFIFFQKFGLFVILELELELAL
jgi:hypothetical protein